LLHFGNLLLESVDCSASIRIRWSLAKGFYLALKAVHLSDIGFLGLEECCSCSLLEQAIQLTPGFHVMFRRERDPVAY
jgi:hypothetical protein